MVVGQAWVKDWQAKTVVPRREAEAWSLDGHGLYTGSRREHTKQEGVLGQDYGTETETGRLRQRLQFKQELRFRPLKDCTTVRSSKHNWAQWGFIHWEQGVPDYLQVIRIVIVRTHEAGQLTSRLWLIEKT